MVTTARKFALGIGLVSVGGGIYTGWVTQQEIKRQPWSPSLDWKGAAQLYFSKKLAYTTASNHEEEFVKASKEASKVQDELLQKILRSNEKTEYGKEYGFELIRTYENFAQFVPLTKPSDYAASVQKIIRGSQNILCTDAVAQIVATQESDGSRRLLPATFTSAMEAFMTENIMLYINTLKAFPSVKSELKKSLRLFYHTSLETSKTGMKIGPISRSPANSDFLLSFYTSPSPISLVEDEPSANYLHFLFAMKDKQLSFIESNSASGLYYAFSDLERYWKHLVEDIRNGTISDEISIPDKVRTELQALNQPDPVRASELDRLSTAFTCCDGYGSGRGALRIWPELKAIITNDTGDQAFYRNKLIKKYTRGLPIISPSYHSAEGLIALNYEPNEKMFVLDFKSHFFEFIPESDITKETPSVVRGEQVKSNAAYEIVLTNNSGLYRYRSGEIVKVRSHMNQALKVEFLYKTTEALSISGERVTEKDLTNAVDALDSEWTQDGRMVLEFSFCPSSLTNPSSKHPHYVAYLEIDAPRDPYSDAPKPRPYINDADRDVLEKALIQQNEGYRSLRNHGAIGPVRVVLVEAGSFARWRQELIKTGAHPTQVSIPRIMRSFPEALQTTQPASNP